MISIHTLHSIAEQLYGSSVDVEVDKTQGGVHYKVWRKNVKEWVVGKSVAELFANLAACSSDQEVNLAVSEEPVEATQDA